MAFIPDDSEPLSDWLHRQARELFAAEYPSEIVEADITALAEKLRSDRSAGLIAGAPGSFDPGNVVYDLPYRRAAKEAPILNELFFAIQAATDEALLAVPSNVARSVLKGRRTSEIEALKLRAFERYRQGFYRGDFRTFTIAGDGAMKEIPPHIWGGDDAALLIANCTFEGRPILVQRGEGAAQVFDAVDVQRQKADAKEFLIKAVEASTDRKAISKKELEKKFGLKPRSVRTIWNEVFSTPPYSKYRAWTKPGPAPGRREKQDRAEAPEPQK